MVSKIPDCDFDDVNTCQSKGSGGHQGTIMSTNKIYCAKIISSDTNIEEDLEYKFLMDKQNQKVFKGFIPKFKGLCNDKRKNKKCLVIENLKCGFDTPVTIDIKIGYHTFNKNILVLKGKPAAIKAIKQKIIDRHSASNVSGFRAEGLEGTGKSFTKASLKRMKPETFLRHFTSTDVDDRALKKIISRLKKFREIVESEKYDNYIMAGSSILITYDAVNPKKVSVKIIDFANSNRYEKLTSVVDRKFNSQYRKAIDNLVYQFENYLMLTRYSK